MVSNPLFSFASKHVDDVYKCSRGFNLNDPAPLILRPRVKPETVRGPYKGQSFAIVPLR